MDYLIRIMQTGDETVYRAAMPMAVSNALRTLADLGGTYTFTVEYDGKEDGNAYIVRPDVTALTDNAGSPT